MQGDLPKFIFWSTTCIHTDVDHKGRNPLPLMSKGESTFTREKHHQKGEFAYEFSVLPSMTKGEIVGHIVIDMLSLMSTVDVIMM